MEAKEIDITLDEIYQEIPIDDHVQLLFGTLKELMSHQNRHTSTGKGSFNNYVDKMRRGGGQKMSVFVHAQGIKTVHTGWLGQKMAKFCPRSC